MMRYGYWVISVIEAEKNQMDIPRSIKTTSSKESPENNRRRVGSIIDKNRAR
jgi:hypothetical protein